MIEDKAITYIYFSDFLFCFGGLYSIHEFEKKMLSYIHIQIFNSIFEFIDRRFQQSIPVLKT